jgi:putative flippase GtrA
MQTAIKNSSQKVRYILVGLINTAIDFSLLFFLKSLGLPAIPSNVISTTCAFCFSFFANKKYTFKSANSSLIREIALFIAVTLFGLWILQTIVINLITASLAGFNLPDNIVLLGAKLVATAVSMVWNYILYSRLVFKQKD